MNISPVSGLGALAQAQKDTTGAMVVKQTMDNLNSPMPGQGRPGEVNPDYQFQKDVLMAGVVGKGGSLNKVV